MSFFLHNLIHFERLLRDIGLAVHAGRTLDAAVALTHVDIGRQSDVHATLRSLFVHRQQDLAPFDEAFRAFWRPPPGDWTTTHLRAMGEQRPSGRPQVDGPASSNDGLNNSPTSLDQSIDRVAPTSFSAREVSRVKDFALFSEEELRQAQAMIAALTWDVGQRRTRRWTPGRSRRVDLRHLARRNLRHGGEPLVLPTRTRVSKRRPLVLLCDVSGSMERYVRMLLQFAHSLVGGLDRVEAFVFATRLTRVTRELGRRVRADELPKVPRRVSDWGGGTRIGEALRTFNTVWARRVMSRGPVVLLISDGWDRGEPDVLAREMARMRRSCHRLIWLNPLIGSPHYEPLTRGMQAALPFVDDFLPVHNLASLISLAEHLNRLPPRGRTPCRQASPPPRVADEPARKRHVLRWPHRGRVGRIAVIDADPR